MYFEHSPACARNRASADICVSERGVLTFVLYASMRFFCVSVTVVRV